MKGLFACMAVLVFLLVGSPVGTAGEVVQSKRAARKESELLRKCMPRACPVFYISALGRTFPIPNRYRMQTLTGASNGFVKFSSPIPEFSSLEAALSGEELTGSIAVGPIEELRASVASGRLVKTKVRKVDDVEVWNVALATDDGRDKTLIPTESVVLLGADDYVQMYDENDLLPELLMGISQRLRDKPSK